jgi:hypothetical protein
MGKQLHTTPQRVWQILTGFAAYPGWNPFTGGTARPGLRQLNQAPNDHAEHPRREPVSRVG